jgi:hypothetical protein
LKIILAPEHPGHFFVDEFAYVMQLQFDNFAAQMESSSFAQNKNRLKMRYLLVLLLCSLFVSCERNIDFDLKESAPTLVVEGEIESGLPPRIVLTKSLDYFSQINPQLLAGSFVHNAEVLLSDGVQTERLVEYSIPLGLGYSIYFYSVDTSSPANIMLGEFNKEYTLTILAEGKSYTATTRIPALTNIPDSVFFRPAPQNPDTNKRVMFLTISDPPGLGNCGRYFTKKNSEPFYPGDNSVYNDDVVDGTTYTVQVEPGINRNDPPEFEENFFKKSDTVTLKLTNIDRATYNFWNTWEFAQQSIGNPFSQPNKVLGNISNGALGAFCGYASWYKTIVVE